MEGRGTLRVDEPTLMAVARAGLFGERLVIVGRIELGAIAAPGGFFDGAIHFAQPRGRHAQRDDLAQPHHHVPRHHFDARRRKGLVKALFGELLIDLRQRFGFVVFEDDGQQERAVAGGRDGHARRYGVGVFRRVRGLSGGEGRESAQRGGERNGRRPVVYAMHRHAPDRGWSTDTHDLRRGLAAAQRAGYTLRADLA
ncbi:hypothetical protein PT2222_60256 [Paraburkholderia tropica]